MNIKYLFSASLYIFIISLVVLPGFTPPPCNPDALLSEFSPKLEDYVFIKAFPIESAKSGSKTDYSYVLSRSSSYRIVICEPSGASNKMIINLYDRDKKLIATNYLKSAKKYFPLVNYTCAATGVYYIEAFFEGESKGCGLNILGFKK